MSKRYIEECDLCKNEAELDNSITIKGNKGKKSGRSYDLCNPCKSLLEEALVSREGLKKLFPVFRGETPENPPAARGDANTLVLDDGTTRPIPSRAELDNPRGDTSGAFERDLPAGTNKDGDPCLHMNRSRPRISADTNKVSYECRDCGATLPYKSDRQKAAELNVKPLND